MVDSKSDENRKIEFIEGKNNVLLIAPHGRNGDDVNTGSLVRSIANKSECYAIINDLYTKPESGKEPNKEAYQVDLNSIKQVKENLKTEFLDKLIEFKDKIIKEYQEIIIIWIHGAKDERVKADVVDTNIASQVKILVGWGQKKDNDRYTAKQETVDTLIKFLNLNDLKAELANPDVKVNIKEGVYSYCGWDSDNMNQLCRDGDYKDEKVKSIQLELRMKGCRDKASLKSTSDAFAEIFKKNNESDNTAAKLPIKYDPDGNVDDKVITAAYEKLKKMVIKAKYNLMIIYGKYLIKTFYDNDYDKAKEDPDSGSKSLSKLFETIQKDPSAGTSYKKTWLYNAIALAVQDDKYKLLKKGIKEGTIQDKIVDTENGKKLSDVVSSWNEKLSITHKIRLENSKKKLSEEEMNKLIIEAAENKMKVAELQKRIDELEAKKDPTKKKEATKMSELQKLQKNLTTQFNEKNISKLDKEELKKFKIKLEEILKNIDTEIPAQ